MSRGQLLIGAVAFVVIVGSCNSAQKSDSPNNSYGSSSNAAVQASGSGPTDSRLAEARCFSKDVVYDGEDTCHPGGEIVSVAEVPDGNTLRLGDGRTVRLLGIQVPDADACSGPGSTGFTRTLVGGKQVKLHKEPGVEIDNDGRLFRYVQYSDSTDRDGLPMYAQDLGSEIVLQGWGKSAVDQANSTYDERIARAASVAEYRSDGIYAPPCGSPKVFGDDDGNGVPDWDERPSGNAPNVNLPDGALTGGYCARKWWC